MNPLYSAVFFKAIAKNLHIIDLKDLLKVTWANQRFERQSIIIRKTKEILNEKIQSQIQKDQLFLKPADIFPFIYLLNVEMDEENIRNFEEYIEKFSTHFKISDISIIMWSIVEKTIIKKKTIFKIIE